MKHNGTLRSHHTVRLMKLNSDVFQTLRTLIRFFRVRLSISPAFFIFEEIQKKLRSLECVCPFKPRKQFLIKVKKKQYPFSRKAYGDSVLCRLALYVVCM